MDPLVHVILPIDKVHTAPQRALDCGPGLSSFILYDIEPELFLDLSLSII